MWGLFALRTRHPPPLRALPLFIEGVPAERGRELRKTPPSLRATSSINRGGIPGKRTLFIPVI